MIIAGTAITSSRRSGYRNSRRRIQTIIKPNSNSSVVNMDAKESSSSALNNGRTDGRRKRRHNHHHQQQSCSTSDSKKDVPLPEHSRHASKDAAVGFDFDDDEGYSLTSAEMSAIRQAILNFIDEDEENYNSDDSGIESCIDETY